MRYAVYNLRFGLGARFRPASVVDLDQYLVQVLAYIPVREPQDSQWSAPPNLVTFNVVVFLSLVDATVQLHDHTRRMAMEVGDEPIDGLLATEMQTTEPIGAQMSP